MTTPIQKDFPYKVLTQVKDDEGNVVEGLLPTDVSLQSLKANNTTAPIPTTGNWQETPLQGFYSFEIPSDVTDVEGDLVVESTYEYLDQFEDYTPTFADENYPWHIPETGVLGDGSEANPYQISTPSQLGFIANKPAFMNSHFVLVNDIDMSEIEGFIPIGEDVSPSANSFQGSFDGQGHVVYNLTVGGFRVGGLFGYLNGAEVKDLGVENITLTATGSNNGGGFAGTISGGTKIERCFVKEVNVPNVSYNYLGGFVGILSSGDNLIEDCYVTGTGTFNSTHGSTARTGGFIGVTFNAGDSVIQRCFVSLPNSTSSGSRGRFLGAQSGTSFDYATYSDNYFNSSTSCSSCNTTGATGLTRYQLESGFTNWDFDTIWNPPVNAQPEPPFDPSVYPSLQWQGNNDDFVQEDVGWFGLPQILGDGTPQDPYQIESAAQLNYIGTDISL